MREKLSEEELIKLRRILLTLCAIDVNSIFNAYAIENVIFGDVLATVERHIYRI